MIALVTLVTGVLQKSMSFENSLEILHYKGTGELRFGVRIDVFVYVGEK